MQIRTFTGQGFGENAYLAACRTSNVCVAIDPGSGAPDLVAYIEREGLELDAILLTHAHLDHIEGVGTVREFAEDVPIWLHPSDRQLYDRVQSQAAMFGMRAEPQPPPTDELEHGQIYSFGASELEVRFTPGHAPGHVVFVSREHGFALVGDVVFQGSIGRTDLPGGDMPTLMDSIRKEILPLNDDTVLYPGHGPPTTVGIERVGNPFVAPLAMGAVD